MELLMKRNDIGRRKELKGCKKKKTRNAWMTWHTRETATQAWKFGDFPSFHGTLLVQSGVLVFVALSFPSLHNIISRHMYNPKQRV
jgi:hypothetical protein